MKLLFLILYCLAVVLFFIGIQWVTQWEMNGQPPWQISQVAAIRTVAVAIFDLSCGLFVRHYFK
jgi:hypothetical protein